MAAALVLAWALVAVPEPAAPPLAERFAAQVSLSTTASQAERELYDEAVRLTLNSPTGRSLAERLLERDRPVRVEFADLDSIGGSADAAGPVARVILGRGMLSWRKEWAGSVAAEVLAHELLGHVLFARLAQEAGVGWEFGGMLADEVNAEVVGWLVGLESGWRFLDPWAGLLLADRAEFERATLWRQPEYAMTLTDAELARPLEAMRKRLADLEGSGFSAADRGRVKAFVGDRLALVETRAEFALKLSAYAGHPFRTAFTAESAARVERLRLIAPPSPEEQSPRPAEVACLLAHPRRT